MQTATETIMNAAEALEASAQGDVSNMPTQMDARVASTTQAASGQAPARRYICEQCEAINRFNVELGKWLLFCVINFALVYLVIKAMDWWVGT